MDDLAWLEQLSPAARSALLVEADRRVAAARLELYRPYAKQAEFHAAGLAARERALIAANQVGKTLCVGAEVAYHVTGRYPSWWNGLRFDRPTRWTCGSESSELTRKGVQRILLGPPEVEAEWGTGMLPHDSILFGDIARATGTPDAVATIPVRHVSGKTSVIQLASYAQGRTKWQADTLDGVWFDEEPPDDVYQEGKTRTNVAMGPVLLSLTPLFGMTTLMQRFLMQRPTGTYAVSMTLDDAEHYTPAQRAAIIDSYPEHERDARTKGVPVMGSGRIFPIDERLITIAPFKLPLHWPRLASLDFGSTHPTACTWQAHDRDTDTIYVYDAYRQPGPQLALHASAIRAKGSWIPVAWPHDGLNETAAGPALAKQYKAERVNMRPTNAKLPHNPRDPTRSPISVEAGLQEMLTRMSTGRYKVFAHLSDWFEEFRMYHRENGSVVKIRDDLMSASRIGVMDIRFAQVMQPEGTVGRQERPLDAEMGY